MNSNRLTAAERAQTQGNLDLVSLFIRELLDAPERFADLPKKATIILLPTDESGDAELTRANIEMAKQLEAQGKHPILVTVGQSEDTPVQVPATLARRA